MDSKLERSLRRPTGVSAKASRALSRLERQAEEEVAAFTIRLSAEVAQARSAIVANRALFDTAVAAEVEGYQGWADFVGNDQFALAIVIYRLERLVQADDVVGATFADRAARGFR